MSSLDWVGSKEAGTAGIDASAVADVEFRRGAVQMCSTASVAEWLRLTGSKRLSRLNGEELQRSGPAATSPGCRIRELEIKPHASKGKRSYCISRNKYMEVFWNVHNPATLESAEKHTKQDRCQTPSIRTGPNSY